MFLAKRRMRRARPTRIRDLVPGTTAKVVGETRADGEPTMAPFTGRACVAIRVVAVRIERSGRRVERVLVADEELGQRFHVDDGTGVCRVERRGWSQLVVQTRAISAGWQFEAERHLDAFFDRYGHHRRTFFDGFTDHVYYERAIVEGDRVAVLGHIEATGDLAPQHASGGYREAPKLMSLAPGDDRLLVGTEPPLLR